MSRSAVDRLACVDLPALPLQLLLQQHPGWQEEPAAVVDRDGPHGRLLWLNEQARAARLLPGMRTAAALALARTLRAAEVPAHTIDAATVRLIRRLQDHTPRVEAARQEPGVFWLDGSGLERLQPSLCRWGENIRSALRHAGFTAGVVVGFARFGTYALARSRPGTVTVLPDRDTETQAARAVSLDRLTLAPAARHLLNRLGITTVGAFIDLPTSGVAKRFDAATVRLHGEAAGTRPRPLQAERLPAPARQHEILEPPLAGIEPLMAVVARLLAGTCRTVTARATAITRVHLTFHFERLGHHTETLRPATPTRDLPQLLDLIRLRLGGQKRLVDAIAGLTLAVEETPSAAAQTALFAIRPRRDLAAANRALARVRAELGEHTVVRACLRDGHLPEGAFTWEPLKKLPAPRPGEVMGGRLVRRLHARPLALPPRPRQEPDGWMLRGLTQGPVVRVCGPYIISGGWWNRTVHREYHFAEVQRGDLLWVYYDRIRRRWFLHGHLE
ncbi:MAG: DNA polymerase Y family protein [Acidobacteriota bacterium]